MPPASDADMPPALRFTPHYRHAATLPGAAAARMSAQRLLLPLRPTRFDAAALDVAACHIVYAMHVRVPRAMPLFSTRRRHVLRFLRDMPRCRYAPLPCRAMMFAMPAAHMMFSRWFLRCLPTPCYARRRAVFAMPPRRHADALRCFSLRCRHAADADCFRCAPARRRRDDARCRSDADLRLPLTRLLCHDARRHLIRFFAAVAATPCHADAAAAPLLRHDYLPLLRAWRYSLMLTMPLLRRRFHFPVFFRCH